MNICVCISQIIKKCFPIIESQSTESNESNESTESLREQPDKPGYYIDNVSGELKKHTTFSIYFKDFKRRRNERICSICLDEEIKTSFTKTKCNHYYHNHCLRKWCKTNNSCPICRFDNIL